jgi:hypothetical protein
MTRSLLLGAAVLTAALALGAPQSADAFRGGFAGGGFHAGGFGGGGAWHAGGGTAWHAGGVYHGAGDWGGTWHGDGWHAGGWYGGGFHGPAVVNSYYHGGCWGCGAAALGVAAAATAVAIGSLVASVPAGCPYQTVDGANYYVCGGTWYQPYYGANGLYYRVVPPL